MRCVASVCVLLVVLAGALLPAAPAAAETVEEAYRGAIKAYHGGRYAEAVDRLSRIAAVPVRHEDLYYNLGCAYYRLGKLGPAIYNFERSLALAPDRDDARFNLETARAQVQQRVKDVLKGVPNQRWWEQLVSVMSEQAWIWLTLVVWWALFAALLLLRRIEAGALRSGLIAVSVLLALLCLVGGAGTAGRVYVARGAKQAVVLPDKVEVREGPARDARASFKLHAGLRVRLRAREAGWVRVRLANGLEGWVEAKAVGVL